MKKKNSRKQFATKHTKAVRAGVLALLEQTNVYQLPERRVALSTAITVANRDLRKTRNSDPETRVFSALRAVSGYLALAANNRVTTAALQNADLLPVGHPSSRARHAMAASALRHARALWVAADPMIDDSMRSLVASAHSAEPGSIERKHAFTRISVAPAGLVPLTAAVDVTPLLAVGLGGNSDFARSARARLQRRDRYGKFAFMGGGFSFNLRGSDGSTSVVSGRVVGGSGTDGVELEIAGSDSLPDGIYTISSSKGTAARAILSEEDVKDLPSREKQDLIGDSVFVSQGDVMSTRKDAPSGWNAQGAESNGVSAYKSDDGYDVTKTTDPATKTASYELSRELDNAPVGEGTFDSWADVQKAALADQDAYKKDLQASEAGDRKVIAPARPRSSDDGYDAIVDQMLEEGWSKTGGDPALGYDRTDTTENHWNAELRRRAMQRDAQRGEYDEWSYTPPDPKKSVGTLGENEKNKVFIDWARQQDNDFYKSVVAQYDKRIGKLTQKQWDALENGFMKDKSSSSFDGTPKDMTPEEKAELIDWVVSGQYLPTTKELQTDGFGVAHNDSSARENRNSLRERMFKALDEGTYVPTETWDRLRALKADEKDKSWDVDQLLVKDSPMRDPDQSAEQTIANTLAMGWRALDNVAPEKPGNEYYVSKAEAQLRDATALLDFIDASDDQRLAASNLRDSIARVKDIEPEPDETSTFSAEIDKFIEANNFKELPEFAEDAIYKLISERNSLAEEDVDRYKEFLDLLDALLSDSGMYLDNGMIYDNSEVTEKQKEQVSRSTMYQRSREFFNNNPELFKPFKQVLAEDIALENEEFGAITLQGLDNAIPSAEDVAKLTEAFDLTLDGGDQDEPPTGSNIISDIFDGAKGKPASEYSDKLPKNSEIVVVAGDGDVLYGRNEDGRYYVADMTVDDDEIKAELIDPSDSDMMTFLKEQFVDGATDTEAPIVFYRGGFVDEGYEKKYLESLPKPPTGGPDGERLSGDEDKAKDFIFSIYDLADKIVNEGADRTDSEFGDLVDEDGNLLPGVKFELTDGRSMGVEEFEGADNWTLRDKNGSVLNRVDVSEDRPENYLFREDLQRPGEPPAGAPGGSEEDAKNFIAELVDSIDATVNEGADKDSVKHGDLLVLDSNGNIDLVRDRPLFTLDDGRTITYETNEDGTDDYVLRDANGRELSRVDPSEDDLSGDLLFRGAGQDEPQGEAPEFIETRYDATDAEKDAVFDNMRESDPERWDRVSALREGDPDEIINASMALDIIYSLGLGKNYTDPATGINFDLSDLGRLGRKYQSIIDKWFSAGMPKKSAEVPPTAGDPDEPPTGGLPTAPEPDEPTPGAPDFVSPEVGLDLLSDALSGVESSLRDIPDEDLDNLDEEDSDAITKVGDLLDSAQDAIDKIDPVGSNTNDIHFEQARADLGEAAQVLSESNNGEMQDAGFNLKEKVDEFINLPQIDFSGGRAERAKAQGTPAVSEPEDIDTDADRFFSETMFDSMFEAPDGAYKVDVAGMYEPQGRTDEDSADFTDDPMVLSQKFDKQELTVALANATVAFDGGDASGYGDLPFDGGDEPVKAEAIYAALEVLEGPDEAERILASIYDAGLGAESTANIDMYEQRRRDAAVVTPGESTADVIPVTSAEDDFLANVDANGVLGIPSRTQLTVELMRDHVETNPKISEVADYLKQLQDERSFEDGAFLEPTLDKYLPWAFSDDPEEKSAFNGLWGMMMSLDGGSSLENETDRTGFRKTLFEALRRQSGASSDTEAADVYQDFVSEYGGFSDFVSGKSAIADGAVGLEDGTVAGDFFRLMKSSSRPNTQELYRVINVSGSNEQLLAQYTTEGNVVGLDPRSFSQNDSTGGSAIDSMTWASSNKTDHRLVFVAAPGEVDSIDTIPVSWFSGENEHLAYGQVEIASVRRQASGLPGRADEFIIEIRRTDTTPEDLVESLNPAPAQDGVSLETFDVSDWKQTGAQAGTNEGGFFEDADGNGYYVKVPKTKSHAENEVLASVLYEELGVPSAQVRMGDLDGEDRIVSKLIPGANPDFADKVAEGDEEYLNKIREDFAIDAWLSNYDVTGTEWENVVTDEHGDPVRVDPGGALMWRARGAEKGGMFGNEVAEIDGLRDPDLNYYGSSVFGSMTDADVKESAKKLLNITPSRIDSIIDSVITSEDDRALLKERLKARRDNILKRFNLSEKDSDVLGNPVPLTNSIGFEAQDLAPGDITASDSFVIENVFRDESTPKGKISVQGYYPGHESQRKEWNETTVIDAARGSTVPPKGDAPAIHRPKKPYDPTPPAFQGEIADAIANAQSWEEVRSILAGRDIVFFDYETTGFGTGSGNNPVQLGAVKMRDGQVVDRFNLFMDPMEDLSDWSRENLKDADGNPLTDEFLSQQSGMGEAHALFAEWAGADAILTAHNTPFDREVLERINAAENVDFTPAGYIDTLKLSRALLNRKTNRDPDGPEGHKLPQLMEHYGLEFAGWHTADADAEATANLFNAMLDDAAGRPDGEASLGVVKDQPSEFEKQIADHQAAVKEYQDALADYNAQIAVAAAWNCGGAGITAAVGEGNGPCSVPSVDELIDASTVKPGQLSDPEAITSGDPALDNDLTGDAVENAAFDGVDTRLPTGVDELPSEDVRQSNISDSFDEVVAQAEAILDPESFKLKKSVSTALEQARDDVAEIRKDLEAGNITEEQAIARLNDVIDSVPEPKGDTPLDVEMGVFRDTIIDLRSTLDNTAYRRPGGPDVPPIETHASRGYSKDGKFLVPGTRVRDKWGYLGTVQRYNKAGWVNVYVTRDIDGKIQSKGTQHLTTVNDEDDQSPWVFDPKIPEGKRPENWQELVPEAATSPKAEAPEGAPEAPEVDNSSEITPAGRPRPAIEKPKSISESSLKGTNSLMGAIEKIKDRNKNKRVYESAPVDGSDIEDFEVRVSTVVIGGERKLRLKFKLTAWAGAEQVRRVDSNPVIDPETRSSWESINYVAIKKSNTLENGDVEIMNRDHLTFGEENGRPDARTLTATAQLSSGEVKISHLRATTEDELDAVSDETDDETPNAFHNMVTIDLPIDATEEDVKRALEIAGVKEVRATEPADVLVLAENRLLSVFGQQTDATVNEENQSRREKALADIERDWGITPSDVEIATDSSGFITYKLPEEAADRIAKRTEATVLRHRINVDSLASSHNPFGSYSALTEEERLDARAAGLVSLITGEGLKATVHRYTEGGSNQQGMSSLDDIYTGGANYVFTNPSGQSFFGFTFSDSDATIYYDPRKAYQRIDFYANEEDEYGKRFTGANVVENATVGEYGSTGAEVMFKNGLSTESSIGIVVSGSVRERMLEMLRERGVDEIAGVSIDKYVLEYLDLDEQQSGKTSVQQMLNQWIDSRNNLYNVYNPSDAFSYFNEIAGDLLVNPVQNIEEPTQLIAYDSKMQAIIRRISDGKFFRVDMINSDSDLAGEPVEIEEEEAFEIVKEIISTNTRLQNALGESSTGFLKSFGDEGIGEYLPAGQALKTNILLLESQLTVATSELQNQNSSDVTDLRMAKFLISALLTSAADDRFDERNIGKKVAEILKNYPDVAGALRDYISSLR